MKLQFSLEVYHWLGQQENKTFHQELNIKNVVEVMKMTNQIFWTDPRVTDVKIQSNGIFDETRRAGMANDKKLSALKFLNTEETSFT